MPTAKSKSLATRNNRSLDEEEKIIAKGLHTFVDVGQALFRISDKKKYKDKYKTFEEYCRKRWEFSRIHCHRLIASSKVVEKLLPIGNILPQTESQVRPLTTLPLEKVGDAWKMVIDKAPKDEDESPVVTAVHVQEVVDKYKEELEIVKEEAIEEETEEVDEDVVEEVEEVVEKLKPKKKDYITLVQWDKMSEANRAKALETCGKTELNKQSGDSIEWALWSWNPVTGCKHGCVYCYARDIANRFYEKRKFQPTILPARLKAPQNTTFPVEKAEKWIGNKNVFTCSMGDLFGEWVPVEWIDAVLKECIASPQWNFLLLTKNPERLLKFTFPKNCWIGTTVDCQKRVKRAERIFQKIDATVKWLSCEPLLEPLKFSSLETFDWLVIGGASSSSKTPEWVPPRQWITELEKSASDLGVKIYEKANLELDRIREYPGIKNVLKELPTKMQQARKP